MEERKKRKRIGFAYMSGEGEEREGPYYWGIKGLDGSEAPVTEMTIHRGRRKIGRGSNEMETLEERTGDRLVGYVSMHVRESVEPPKKKNKNPPNPTPQKTNNQNTKQKHPHVEKIFNCRGES